MSEVAARLGAVYRAEHGRLVATLIRIVRDFQLAEDCVHEAVEAALSAWERDGVPANPGAWLTTTARNRAIDRVRRRARFAEKADAIAQLRAMDQGSGEIDLDAARFRDDRLRLIFTCCHPALSLEAQVALTLRTLGGLTTEEIARAFLIPAPTMAQRLVRAKRKIRDAGIPYEVPPPAVLPERAAAARATLYLVFNQGYGASGDARALREELCSDAIRLARLLAQLLPDDPENLGLLALMLLHDARRDARFDGDGGFVLLDDQDRSLWRKDAIEEGCALVDRALRVGRAGPYQVQAAIAALHCEARSPSETDWPQIAALYALLVRMQPSPVIELNRAVAVAMAEGPERGLALIDALRGDRTLSGYPFFHSARADLLRRLGRFRDAAAAYEAALALEPGDSDRAFLARRLDEVRARGGGRGPLEE